MRSCTHFFPHDFVRSISPGILSRWALRPEHDRSPKYQSSQCCPNPWKKTHRFWKQPFLCSRFFFFKHETAESGETEHLFFLGFLKEHFNESFIYKQKACKNVKLNISKSWKSVIDSPFNPYMLRDLFFDQISRTIPQPTHRLNGMDRMGFTWHLCKPRVAKDRQPWKEANKGWVSPKSWRWMEDEVFLFKLHPRH